MKIKFYINRYGYYGTVYLILSFIYTKLYFKNIKLIRLPIDIRNKKLIDFGRNLTTGKYCRIEVESIEHDSIPRIRFGNNVQINDFVHITAAESIKIGNNVLIASRVYISDCSHGNYNGNVQSDIAECPSSRKIFSKPIEIGDNVWIGEGVCILSGVKIGYGSIIGSNSVVTKDIPSKSIAVGSPAKVIKVFNDSTKLWELI